MPGTTLQLDTPDGSMPTFEARPDGPAKGGIVVIQEAFGVTRHIEEVAERLAGSGWHALAPALFHRQGSPVLAYDDFTAVLPLMGALTAGGISADVAAALAHLDQAGHPAERQGIVGFCMGGSVAFYAAVEQAIGAAVTYYGGGIAEGRFGYPSQVEAAGGLRTAWLGLYGDEDQGIPPEQVEALRGAAKAAPVPTEVVRYAEGKHGFNCNDRPDAYDAQIATDAWGRALAWFDAHIGTG
jgi:carboxymethylenebutenolidase